MKQKLVNKFILKKSHKNYIFPEKIFIYLLYQLLNNNMKE